MNLAPLFLLIATAWSLPQGAPPTVCRSMIPYHGGGIPPQNGIPPYSVIPRRHNGHVQVSITSTLGVRFQGFLLQGRTPSGEILGVFDSSTTNDGHPIDCGEPGDSMTHNSPGDKGSFDVVWLPPGGYEGLVIFNATVAQDYNTFWVGVESPPVEISKRAIEDPEPFVPKRTFVNTPPPFFRPDAKESSTDFDPFYDGCATRKLCFGSPVDCVNSRNCKAVVAVTVTGDRYDFELKAEDNAQWVGVGLSEDAKMGDDSVIECVKKPSGGVSAHMSWTSGPPNYGAARTRNSQLGIQLLNSSVVDGVLYCKVRRDPVTVVNGKTFDLISDRYNLLVAAGSSLKQNSVGFHDLVFLASGSKQALSDVSPVAAASKLLIRLHGSFMLVAWVGTASIAILIARYYRQTWVGSSICGKDVWFAWHRMLMILTWTLTMVGFVLIFVELRAWSNERNPHAILGIIVTILCFFQPIGAYFRPHPGTPKRPLFNWLHWLVGNTAHIGGIVAIFFAVSLTKAELPEFFIYILAVFVAFHSLTHLILTIMGCISEKSSEGRISAFPMKDLGTGRNLPYADRNVDAPFSMFRRSTFALYVFVNLAIVTALVVIIAGAPIEENWAKWRS